MCYYVRRGRLRCDMGLTFFYFFLRGLLYELDLVYGVPQRFIMSDKERFVMVCAIILSLFFFFFSLSLYVERRKQVGYERIYKERERKKKKKS